MLIYAFIIYLTNEQGTANKVLIQNYIQKINKMILFKFKVSLKYSQIYHICIIVILKDKTAYFTFMILIK